jgi:hypothetical protein
MAGPLGFEQIDWQPVAEGAVTHLPSTLYCYARPDGAGQRLVFFIGGFADMPAIVVDTEALGERDTVSAGEISGPPADFLNSEHGVGYVYSGRVDQNPDGSYDFQFYVRSDEPNYNFRVERFSGPAGVIVHPWQNPVNRFDVANIGAATPLSILVGINDQNQWGSRLLNTWHTARDPYLDVNGDRRHTPGDILEGINHQNQIAMGIYPEGEAFGQSVIVSPGYGASSVYATNSAVQIAPAPPPVDGAMAQYGAEPVQPGTKGLSSGDGGGVRLKDLNQRPLDGPLGAFDPAGLVDDDLLTALVK